MDNLTLLAAIFAIVKGMDEIPPEVRDHRLTRLIGRGATADVWRARRAADDELVAVKILPGRADEEAVREYALLQHAASEHVVTLHETIALDDIGTGEPGTALVLDLLAGGCLGGVIAERGHLTPGETVTIIAPIAEALAGLHDIGIVHGDVSPGNVLLDSTGRPSLTDLGFSRLTGEQPGEVHGTDGHVAPEVLEGGEPTRASDVYALGALAWLCLVGDPPGHVAERVDLAEVVAAPELIAAVEASLATEPDDRPEADEAALAFFDAAAAEPLRMTSPGDVASGLTRRIREAAGEGEAAPPSWQRELAAQAAAAEAGPTRWWRRLRTRRGRVEETGERRPGGGERDDSRRERRDRPAVEGRGWRGRHRLHVPRHAGGRHAASRRGHEGATGGRARRHGLLLTALAGLLVALLVPWQQLATAGGAGSGTDSAPRDGSSAPSTSNGATARSPSAGAVDDALSDRSAAREAPRALASALTDLREQAVVDVDGEALARLVETGSPAAERDGRLLEDLRFGGQRFHGVDFDVREATLHRAGESSAVLRTTIDEGAYEVRDTDGTRERRAAREDQAVDLVVVWRDSAWRVRDVRAAPTGSR